MIKYSGIYESSTPPTSTKALWVDGGVLKIYKNGSWRPVDDPKSKLTIDSILKAGSTNPVENRAIYIRFIGVDKYIEVNRNNITDLTKKTDKTDGIAKGAEALAKVNEKRLNGLEATANRADELAKRNEFQLIGVRATANTALANSRENQDSVRNAQVTANEAKTLVEGLTATTKTIESNVLQLQELNVVYPNNIRNLTTESTEAEVKEAFIPAIGGSAGVVNTPHVGYLIKGAAHRDSPEDAWESDPGSTIISVDIIKTDNKDYHKFIYVDNNTAIISVTVDLVNYRLIDKSTLANIEANSKVGTLRDLYISAGAVYNKTTGYYELNGLTDITEEEMRVIYKYAGTPQTKAAFAYSKARTNLPMPGMYNGTMYGAMFYGCSNLEVAYLGNKQSSPTSYDVPLVYTEGNNCFYLCKKLKKIYGKIHQRDNWNLMFGDCIALEEVRIAELYSSIQLSWSPNLSKESVQYMITNAKPQSGAAAGSIAITLHPTAYARLKDDADIVAALEAKGGIITLVSA
nr:MAG TPA: hypothetical protein [Crassvirales sp.]